MTIPLTDLEYTDDGRLKIPRSSVMWEWDYSGRDFAALSEAERESMKAFLRAHDIDPNAFLEGNFLRVFLREPGQLWLYAWRAVGNDSREAPLCPHCPSCIKQEEVLVPVTTALPAVRNAYVPPHVEVPTMDGE